jgi:integrase
MGKRKEGSVVQRPVNGGTTFALRFSAYGEPRYVTLGTNYDGWDVHAAETELANIMADVRRQIWVPPDQNKPPARSSHADTEQDIPTLRAFTERKLAAREHQVEERTHEHDEWALRLYLWPYFGDWSMSDFTDVASIDDFRDFLSGLSHTRLKAIKAGRPLRDANGQMLRPLSASTINRIIGKLGPYLELAVEYDWVPRNIAIGKNRRLKVKKKRPVHIDTAQQVEALIVAAGQLDLTARWRCSDRRAIVATLLLAGPRAGEVCALLWRDVDLANRRISIGRSKTAAGLREIPMAPALHRELTLHRARSENPGPDDLVFPTSTGRARNKDNLRERMLHPCLAVADELLLAAAEVPLPHGVTPHKLRHAFASIMVACGEDPARVQRWIGHTDPRFTMKVYTHMMARSPEERAHLKTLVYGEMPASEPPTPAPHKLKPSSFDLADTHAATPILAAQGAPPTTSKETPITMSTNTTNKFDRHREVMTAVKMNPGSTIAELADLTGLACSTTGKILNQLKDNDQVVRMTSGMGEGSTADTWKKKRRDDRLKPGELYAQVRDYLYDSDEPLGAVAIARALNRSSGAVFNCLVKMKRNLEAEVVQDKPLRYAPKKRVPIVSLEPGIR